MEDLIARLAARSACGAFLGPALVRTTQPAGMKGNYDALNVRHH